MPSRDKFAYTFDNLAKVIDEFTEKLGLTKYALYVQDYGAPVGYRLAVAHPERITAIVVQNGNAYDEGLDNDFWKPIKAYWKEPNSKEKRDALRAMLTYDATKWQYTHGVKDPELVSPDGAAHDQFLLDRKGNDEIQLDLFLSYGSNPPLYPKWQAYFREHQPPMLIVWGKNDQIFPAAGRRAVQARPEDAGVPPARRRALRPGNERRRDRRADARVPRQARGEGVTAGHVVGEFRRSILSDRQGPNRCRRFPFLWFHESPIEGGPAVGDAVDLVAAGYANQVLGAGRAGSTSAKRISSASAPARARTVPDGSAIELQPMNRNPLSTPTRFTAIT